MIHKSLDFNDLDEWEYMKVLPNLYFTRLNIKNIKHIKQ